MGLSSANEIMLAEFLRGERGTALSGSKTGVQASDTITLSHTAGAHDAGDVVSTAAGENLEFASLGAAGDMIMILGVQLKYAVNAIPTACAGYNLHLFSAAPTAIADNAAFNVVAADKDKYLDCISIPALTDRGDNCFARVNNENMSVKLVGTGLYGQLQCIAAETPAIDSVFTVVINAAAV